MYLAAIADDNRSWLPLIIIAGLLLLVWLGGHNRREYKSYLSDTRAMYEAQLAQMKEIAEISINLEREVLSELKAIRALMEKNS
jgi:hypothetical protein